MSKEILSVEVSDGTCRRLEVLGFPHDLTGREVVRFLIEEGLGVLEKNRSSEATCREKDPDCVVA